MAINLKRHFHSYFSEIMAVSVIGGCGRKNPVPTQVNVKR